MGCSDLWTLNLVGTLKCLFCSVYKQKILITIIEKSDLEYFATIVNASAHKAF